ncbi:hypothetical protein V3C99_005088 [Haemonchus contortus]|uniref:Craniofacial development protein 2-like n=1 Tax=Haemonchus contortus TaxID=6289 RepID=A0A7I4XTV0_HAECO
MDLEMPYRKDHTFFKVIVGDFNAKIGLRRMAGELHIGTHGMEWNEQGESLRWIWESRGGQFYGEIDPSSSIGSFASLTLLLFRSST